MARVVVLLSKCIPGAMRANPLFTMMIYMYVCDDGYFYYVCITIVCHFFFRRTFYKLNLYIVYKYISR